MNADSRFAGPGRGIRVGVCSLLAIVMGIKALLTDAGLGVENAFTTELERSVVPHLVRNELNDYEGGFWVRGLKHRQVSATAVDIVGKGSHTQFSGEVVVHGFQVDLRVWRDLRCRKVTVSVGGRWSGAGDGSVRNDHMYVDAVGECPGMLPGFKGDIESDLEESMKRRLDGMRVALESWLDGALEVSLPQIGRGELNVKMGFIGALFIGLVILMHRSRRSGT